MPTLSPDVFSRLIVEHVCDGIVLTDDKCKIVWINPAFTRMSGYELEDLLGKKPADVLQGPDTSPESTAALGRAIALREPCKVDIVNYSKAGEAYTSEINLSPMFDADGALTHFVAVQRDVTEERALAQESVDFKAYQRALELQAIVSVTDARGRITFVNQKFCDISGYDTEDLIGKTHKIVNSGHHDRSFFVKMWQTIRAGETWHGEVCNRTKSGEIYWVDTTVVPVHGSRGEILRYVSTRYDITERKQAESELIRQAEMDALTGLANRPRFMAELRRAAKEADQSNGQQGGLVVMIDLDHFKDLNDSLGHHMGDLLLKETALRLSEFIGPNGLVARLGGDEFAAIVPDALAPDPQVFMRNLHAAACASAALDGVIYLPSYSMGVARFPTDGRTAEGLLINADVALYDAKRNGRKTWRLFDPEVRQKLDHRNHLKSVVTEALEQESFEIFLQPICHAKTQEHAGFEVLARLFHDGAYVPPDQFIPVAEEYGLIPDVGRCVLAKALLAFREMKARGLAPGTLAINMAAPQLREPGFAESVLDMLLQHGISATDLMIEITETALIGRSTEVVADTLRQFHEMGVGVALDDFGTGFSSLAHLRDFPVNKIKIDKSFVQDLENAPADKALIRGLVELARSLNLSIVAEGVETQAQYAYVKEVGCTYVQGYYHAKPMSVADATAFLSEMAREARAS